VDPRRELPSGLSIGTTSDGRILDAAVLPHIGPHHEVLPFARPRRTNHGNAALVELITWAAARVAAAHPGSRLQVGNLSRRGGGPLEWSRSHRAGRDADLAFFVLQAGRPTPGPNAFPRFGDDLRAAGWRGLTLDVARTWTLVKALLTHPTIQVQWLFIATPLRRALLDHARGEPADLLARAERALWQPTDSRSHDDHLHVRITCSRTERLEGCRNRGTLAPGVDGHDAAVAARIAELEKGLTDPSALMRLRVLAYLMRLDARTSAPRLARVGLKDPDVDLRQAVLSLLLGWTPPHPDVIAEVEAFLRRPGRGFRSAPGEGATPDGPGTPGYDAVRSTDQIRLAYQLLEQAGSPASLPFLLAALRSRRVLVPTPRVPTALPEALIAIRAARFQDDLRLVPALIDTLEHPLGSVRHAAAEMLSRLTNHHLPLSWVPPMGPRLHARQVKAWRDWWRAQAGKDRWALLLQGFRKINPRVRDLTSEPSLRALVRLTQRIDYLGYNADRALVRATGVPAPRDPGTAAERHRFWVRWWVAHERKLRAERRRRPAAPPTRPRTRT
jgi:penicillin-insensitive murein endopeptidase